MTHQQDPDCCVLSQVLVELMPEETPGQWHLLMKQQLESFVNGLQQIR
ncbi:hypothetical protein HNP46_005792 [Pseudomonas nitritireducens]|uniref:Uncharacterized protein n=1 Tax=Pseudomonas nitroreducens TaxID=46680 RepID=A0A7W7P4Q3_PSENT|nr:hypothetical protein [Pseudomonas nitritireducens]MBB4866885.1 hypothetical protein [Pseudomonas nitritireducens]